LPQPNPALLNRRALVVKIDNLSAARPQSGITSADICYEEQVEAGITRLACVFQSTDPGQIGPIRSTRTTDIALVSTLNHPLYAYSGGAPSMLAAIRSAPIVDVGADARGGAYYRIWSRPSPHNLFTTSQVLYSSVRDPGGPPSPQFDYLQPGGATTAAGVTQAGRVSIKFPQSGPEVSWTWDSLNASWMRSQDWTPDLDARGTQISAANVIFEFVPYSIVAWQTIDGVTGPVPEANLVGGGEAWVLTGGRLIVGRWYKSSTSSITQFTDASGAPILLTPGKTWVELPAVGTPVKVG
jgi:hypothetical protein